jgi:hypothetical protein
MTTIASDRFIANQVNALVSVDRAIELIKEGRALSFAGQEACLDKLPRGNWVAGTIPYFMGAEGGVVTAEKVFATVLADGQKTEVAFYGPDALECIVGNAPENGYTFAVMPYGSNAHRMYAESADSFEGAFLKPTVGWVAGIDLADLGKVTPKVYNGKTGTKHEEGVVVMHVSLPDDKLATIEIVNIFEQDAGDVITFQTTGFKANDCFVNGKPAQLGKYLAGRGNGEGKLPMIGDYSGARINVGLQTVNADSGECSFYGPVFPGVEYRLAKPVTDYADRFRSLTRQYNGPDTLFACNCIVNFLHGGLEGKNVGGVQGPVTFGEIGFQLLTQTMVVLRIR